MLRYVFPFNYVIPGQSTNTLFHFRSYCERHPHLSTLFRDLQLAPDFEDTLNRVDNRHSANEYSVLNFVADMPVRLPAKMLESVPRAARALGSVAFVQTEFQIIDRLTEHRNELGAASHAAYKERQKESVRRRLQVGIDDSQLPPPPDRNGNGSGDEGT
jgi:uncharacterized protein (TIGR04552 family)